MWKRKLGGSVEEAAEHAERALALDPDELASWDTVGETWETLGEYERALGVYEEALERFPSEPRAQMRLAIQYARLGDEARAAEHLARAGDSAKEPWLANRLGIVYAARGDAARAEQLFRDVEARAPESGARAYLARLLRETGRAAEAQRLIEQGAPLVAPKPRLEGLTPGATPRG
jgi:tetratricopeptide (TPR) repeat protein